MSTDSNVIVSQYRAEFKGVAPFSGRKGWILGPWQYCETIPNRRAWTVARDVLTNHPPDEHGNDRAYDITDDIRRRYAGITLDARGPWFAVVVPDPAPGHHYGTVLLIEQRPR